MSIVSIIVPIFNVEKYLEKCLTSLANQTLEDIEIIAIDDGSTDTSGKILDLFQKKYPNKIRAYHQENLGISATRNRGIDLAEGKYVAFIDSDDSVDLEFCQRMYGEMEKRELDVVVCDFFETDGENKKEMKIPYWEDCTVFEKPNLLFDINTSPWNKLYRKDFLLEQDIKFPINLKYEDAVFFQKILSRKAKVGKVDAPLVYYLVRPGSETTVVRKTVFDIFEVLDMICAEYQKNSSEEYKKISMYLEYFVTNRITVYNIQQIWQEDSDAAMKFIETGFAYLDRQFPQWRKNSYFNRTNNFGKKVIKKHKLMNKMFVGCARKFIRRGTESERKNQ